MTSLSTGNHLAVQDVLDALYQAVNTLTDRLDRLDSRLAALESKPPHSAAVPKSSDPPASAPKKARTNPKKKTKETAPTIPSTTKVPAHSIRNISTQDVQEKITVTLSIPDVQAGHVIGRAGTGLRQIHDISHAKLSVSPTVVAGSRVVTIRGTGREAGDAVTAIGKRLARRRLRAPRSTKKKTNPSSPPIVITGTAPSTPAMTSQPPTRGAPSRQAPLTSPTLPSVESSSGPPSVGPSASSSTVVDASRFPRVAATMAARRLKGP